MTIRAWVARKIWCCAILLVPALLAGCGSSSGCSDLESDVVVTTWSNPMTLSINLVNRSDKPQLVDLVLHQPGKADIKGGPYRIDAKSTLSPVASIDIGYVSDSSIIMKRAEDQKVTWADLEGVGYSLDVKCE
ncbi:hypothetical protein [Rhodanobacter glycinis]|nr:hypothetical protein [Rhodanobacter glycinis]